MPIEKITQTISDYPAVAERLDEAFYEDMEAWITHGANITKDEQNNLRVQINNVIDGINVSINDMNILKNQAESVTSTASTSAATATQKASEANSSANQALNYYNLTKGLVILAGASYGVEQINTQNSAMTKAQFNALAEERKANRAGSGFDEFGKHSVGYASVNDGIIVSSGNDYVNAFQMGWNFTSQLAGVSKTNYPILNVNGVLHKLFSINRASTGYEINKISLPTAPNIYPYDAVLTTEQINSGVIKHADASNSGLIVNGKFDVDTSGWTTTGTNWVWGNGSAKLTLTSDADQLKQPITTVIGKKYIVEFDITNIIGALKLMNNALVQLYTISSNGRHQVELTADTNLSSIIFTRLSTGVQASCNIDNISVYPADAISRSDLVFLESWHEDVSEKNIVYPLGNTQYLGGNTDGLTGIANGSFSGFETYSLFGNWMTPSALIGKGYIWANLTEAQRKAFIANPDNNCYLDGDKVIQVRYRVRVVQGWGDDLANITPYNAYLSYAPGVNPKPKGKLVSIAKDVCASDTNGIYGHGTTVWTSALPYASEFGIFSATTSYNSTTGFLAGSYNGQCFALPLCLVHRRNQGMYHNVFNPNGTKLASDGLDCFRTSVSFTNLSDCFNPDKLLTASGYIGTVSGRPDGLFYDQIHEGDIQDLRNSSKKVEDYNRLINREFNKLVAGTYRGKEGEWKINKSFGLGSFFLYDYDDGRVRFYTYDSNMNLQIGDTIQVVYFNGTNYIADRVEVLSLYSDITHSFIGRCSNISASISSGATASDRIKFFMYSNKTTRTKSNTLLHCDIIGNPNNYTTAWKESGVFGTPLIVAEDGTSLLPDGVKDTFKLSRQVKQGTSILLALRSIDNGATWTSFAPAFSTTANSITLTNEPAGNLVMVYYQTKTSMAVPTVNSEVLEIGDALFTHQNSFNDGGHLLQTLTKKVGVAGGLQSIYSGIKVTNFYIGYDKKLNVSWKPINTPFEPTLADYPAVKVFPYLTRTNGKAYLNLVFKEMKHNGTSWGDDAKFNIVDNVSTTTDNNGQTVLIGQKTVELPYFIDAGE